MWLQTPLELFFFFPPLESLIAHGHCTLRSVGVVDTHIYMIQAHTHTHTDAVSEHRNNQTHCPLGNKRAL